MKKTLTLAAALLIFGATASQAKGKDEPKSAEKTAAVSTYTLSGKVTDLKAGETLVGATVTVNGKKVFTDLDGNFTIEDVSGKECEIQVNMISYKPEVVKVAISNKENKNIQIALKQ